jgi:hypothetical protein
MSTLNQKQTLRLGRATVEASPPGRPEDGGILSGRSLKVPRFLSWKTRAIVENWRSAAQAFGVGSTAFGRRRPGQEGGHALAGERVRSEVEFVVGVAFDPAPRDRVPLGGCVEASPEILVLDRLS